MDQQMYGMQHQPGEETNMVNYNEDHDQSKADFGLDDLNFDPATLIGGPGNGNTTDLSVSHLQIWTIKEHQF